MQLYFLTSKFFLYTFLVGKNNLAQADTNSATNLQTGEIYNHNLTFQIISNREALDNLKQFIRDTL